MLDKTYRPGEVEPRWYARWEDAGAFAAGQRPDAPPFTVVIPPPNVTGSLHMGHALNNTLQDILVRWHRMRGFDTLWQPGMDHAGIATQMVVERQLAEAGEPDRRTLGREEFVKRVWAWKERSGGTIINQLRRLGASCDWSRERFTMDEGLSAAVREVFVTLYREGLIYRDKRLVNWDPKFHTAISDLEVEQRETRGHLWHFRYPLEGEEGRTITVATTRPETMLGDAGVAVHPDDERYRDLIGKYVILPLVGRRIPIIADEHADPEQGSGAVKITPAHDFNDFEVGRRHGLENINIFDIEARLNDTVPEAYRGLDRFEARRRIVADLDALGLVEKIEDHDHVVPYGDRSGVVIEPRLTDQWFADAPTLAGPAIAAVRAGDTRFVPKQWDKTFFEWMNNIQPWCISRQLWWGHRIPAWYGPDGEIFVAKSEDEARRLAERHYGGPCALRQDEDVLDTWFSSQLWPFSTLGWPEDTPELKRYYQTDVLVTGFDIIFFWVARMMMAGLHFMHEVPFHTVYIHALVRDEQGRKMSKSKGNVIDPLATIETYGADALRFTLAAMEAQGRDIRLSDKRIEGYRNFATKLWNAARFCKINDCRGGAAFAPADARLTVNRWIIGEVAKTARRLDQALEGFRFNDAAGALYHFVWGSFCDWYVEFIKPILGGDDDAARAETRACAAWVLDQILILLHPFMPFITEELWNKLADRRDALLITTPWPDYPQDYVDAAAEAEIDWVIRLVSAVRALRAEMRVPPAARVPARLHGASPQTLDRLAAQHALITRLARLDTLSAAEGELPPGAIQLVIDEATLGLALADVIDVAAERARLTRELEKAHGDIAAIDKRLGNEKFLTKAPEKVIAENRARRADAEQTAQKLHGALERLAQVG